jgi:Tfp pilus assembly protein PilN
MIEINLLPGGGKKSRGRNVGAGLAGTLSAVLAKVKDPYLLSAVGSSIAAVLIIVLLYVTQTAREHILISKEQKAVQDSTRYATVVAEKRKAEAQRDSVLRQVNIIRAIDDDRFVWTHIMDEVSRVVPPYTWLTAVAQTSEVVSPAAAPPPAPATAAPAAGAAAAAKKPDAKAGDAPAAVDTAVVRAPLSFRIIGLTVDIQALTRFMRFLETSPFIQNVQLAKTTPLLVEGNQVHEFHIDADYETPDPAAIRRVPFTLSGR